MSPRRFRFAVDRKYASLVSVFGVREDQDAGVEIDGDTFSVRFGYWVMTTPIANLADARVDGPFSAPKVLGVHLSFADRGITFGTNTDRGACIRFRRPVPGIEPLGLIRHPGVTVTVDDPQGLAEAVEQHVTARERSRPTTVAGRAVPGTPLSSAHDDRGEAMSESGEKSAPRPTAESDEDAARKEVNPDLHGQAKDVEEKRANNDPEATGA